MGLWQKTMFYLGLVDEDAVGYEEVEEAPRPRRQASRSRPEPGRAAPEPRREAPAPRREPAARREPARRQPREPEATDPEPRKGPMRSRGATAAPPADTGERPQVQVNKTARVKRSAEPAPQAEPQVIRGGYPSVSGRRVEPPTAGGRRRPLADQALSEAGVVVQPGMGGRSMGPSDLESQVIVARSYNDAQVLADHIRANVPVVLDLRNVEPAMVRRLVDFSSGLTYALGGTMRKIGQGVVLVTPAAVSISREERRRLRDLGYYQAPEEG